MPAFPREEIEEMLRRWIAANDEAGPKGDWSKMPEFYTEDAIYSWNNGPKTEFVARGRKQIAEWAFGTEMAGLEGWTYPYVRTLIDDQKGEVLGVWRQLSPRTLTNPKTGEAYEIAGTGGSWFRYAGDFKWDWQRDFFDHGNMGNCFMQMIENEQMNDVLMGRIKKGRNMPGWVKRDEFDWYATIENPEA